MATIYILWLRQVKRYLRSKARIVGSLGQPVLFLVALGLGFGPIYAKAGQGNYVEFIGPGVVAMAIIFTAIFSGIEIIWDRQFGFLKETLVAPVSRTHIMIGRTLGGATVAMIQGMVVLVIAMLVGFRPVGSMALPLAFVFMLLIALLFTALGTAIATQLADMQAFPLIMNFLVMPIFFLSGAIFPVVGLPASITWVVRANPLAYGVDGLRGTLVGVTHFGLLTDVTVLSVLTAVLLVIGSRLFSRIQI